MTQSISAAIHIHGSTIRYAALARDDETLRLRRLGQRTFGMDVGQVLWEGADGLDQVETAVQEVLDGVEVTSLRLVLPPLDVYSFFAPVPGGLSARERKRHVTPQAALVTGARSSDTLRLTLRPVRTVEEGGEAIEWVHVLAVPRDVHERLEGLLGGLPGHETGRMVSSEASARLVGHAEPPNAAEDERSFQLTIGAYPSHTEYALLCDREWYHAHATQEGRTAANRAYYAVGGLNRVRVPPSAVDRVFVYGPDADSGAQEVYEATFECPAAVLNPFERLPSMAGQSQNDDAPQLHVPCIGGALDGPA